MAESGASADRAVRPGVRTQVWNLGLAALIGVVFGLGPHTSGHRVVPSIIGGVLAGLGFLALRLFLQRRRGSPVARVEPAWRPPPRMWLALLLVAAVFAPTAGLLFREYTDSIWMNAHGLFVPLAIVWLGAAILRRDTQRGEESSAWGFVPLVLGLALVVLDGGARTAQIGALGIAVSLPGFSLLLLGPRRTKALAVPLLLGFFLIPLSPFSLADLFRMPTATAAGMLPLLGRIGLPALREGAVLTLPTDVFGISANCSGFATFYAATGVAIVLAAHSRSRLRAVLLLLAPWPLSLLANILRSTALVAFSAHRGIAFLDTPWHGVSGIAAFWLAIGGLLLLADWPTLRKSLA